MATAGGRPSAPAAPMLGWSNDPEADAAVEAGRTPRAGPVARAAILIGLALLYAVAAKVGLLFAAIQPSATPVWPPSGIAFAALLLLGYRTWPAILAGAFLANVTTAGSVATSVGIAAGNTLEGLTGAHLVNRFANGPKVFERAGDIFAFVGLAALGSTTVSATVGVTSLSLGGYARWADYGPVWLTWWLGDATGNLIFAPALVLWARNRSLGWSRARAIEALLLLFGVILVGTAVFGRPSPLWSFPLSFLGIPPLLWAAFRFGPRETATATVLLSAIAVWGTLSDLGDLTSAARNDALLLLQTFTATMSVTALSAAALVWERRRAEAEATAALAMLRRLQTVTDNTLSQVSLAELLRGLLRRVRTALESDTAAVLLMDPDGRHLATVATSGLREEVGDVVRVPLGQGIAAGIATSERGLVVDDLGALEPVGPFLGERVASLVGVPLKSDGHVIGVLHAGSVKPRRFTQADLQLLELIGHRAVLAIERTRSHERERAARAEAEAANRTKDEFLAMLGHELRNPLGAIASAVRVLDQVDARGDHAAQARAVVARQVERLARMVDDLLDVARVTTGKVVLHRRPVDLADCATACITTLNATERLGRHDVRVQAEPAWVDGDPARLEQIVTNLLLNATKYTPPVGRILVSVRPEADQAVLQVEDSGVGIPRDLLPRIFDLFVQGDRERDRAHGGLGIGLTLVRRLVELHGGWVEVASGGAGRGSTFTVRLPRLATPRAQATPAGPSTTAWGRRRVLIIEDYGDARDSLRAVLELAGHEVHAAEDGASGVELALKLQPDLVLVAIGLPGLDGYEVARRIRSKPEGWDMVLVALTGYGQPEDRRQAEEAGFDAHFVKPLDHDRLGELLAAAPRQGPP
jgi:signal transduction histidine kinase/integral membrane sensor domain MASE1